VKPNKTGTLSIPMRTPPTARELAARKLRLMKMRKLATGESGEEALDRARRTMPWGEWIANKDPFYASEYWIWLVRESYFATKEAA
jgi:hypothetical protein